VTDSPSLPLPTGAYILGAAFDEMFAPDGSIRPHYAPLHERIRELSGGDLAERQRL